LKRYKSPGSDQIPAELIQAGGEIYAFFTLFVILKIMMMEGNDCQGPGRGHTKETGNRNATAISEKC
jgi:hypothetical protein